MTDGDLTVEAYSGVRYAERPLAFLWQGRRYQVLSIENRWRSPDRLGFTVIANPESGAGSEPGDTGVAAGPCDAAAETCVRQRWRLTYDEVQRRWYGHRTTFDDEGAA